MSLDLKANNSQRAAGSRGSVFSRPIVVCIQTMMVASFLTLAHGATQATQATQAMMADDCQWTAPGVMNTVYDLSHFSGRVNKVTDRYNPSGGPQYEYDFGICGSITPPMPACENQTALPDSAAYQICQPGSVSCDKGTCNSLGSLDNKITTLLNPVSYTHLTLPTIYSV